jgi:hypothetical protein
MTEKLSSFLCMTPFGPFGTLCNESLSILPSRLGYWHMRVRSVAERVIKNATILRELQRRMLEDGILFKWHEADRKWLSNYAAAHLANIWANVQKWLVLLLVFALLPFYEARSREWAWHGLALHFLVPCNDIWCIQARRATKINKVIHDSVCNHFNFALLHCRRARSPQKFRTVPCLCPLKNSPMQVQAAFWRCHRDSYPCIY